MSDKYLTVARRAATAGAEQLEKFKNAFSVKQKAPKDLVTEADLASQKAIQSEILGAFSDHLFVGEEDGCDSIDASVWEDPEHRPIWIVDPLDGTVNYVHQLQNYAVSIALFERGRIQLGVVLDAVSRDCYWAIRGQGAFMNDAPIGSSQTNDLRDALLACSFSTNVTSESEEMKRFASVLGHAQAIRRLGSAAMNMCYVATGSLDGYWATSVKPWDVAAGALIVAEAGGTVQGIFGEEFDPWDPKFVASGTKCLGDAIIKCF